MRGFFFVACEKSHHENVVAKFNFTANFAEARGSDFLLLKAENCAVFCNRSGLTG